MWLPRLRVRQLWTTYLQIYIFLAKPSKKTWINISLKLATKSALNLRHSLLSQSETIQAYQAVYLPSLMYPLGTSPLGLASCQKINETISSTFLAFQGYPMSLPCPLAYTPEALMGVGLRQIECEQGLLQLHLLMHHLRLSSPTGQMVHSNMEWLQLHTGTTFSIFENTIKCLPHLPHTSWLVLLRVFLGKIQGSLCTTIQPTTLRRNNDVALMEAFLNDWLSQAPKHLQELNHCCLYLQVEMLADICDPDGQTLDPSMLLGHCSLLSSTSNKEWPIQERPGNSSWKCWKTQILTNFAKTKTKHKPIAYIRPFTLTRPLQHWHPLPANHTWQFPWHPIPLPSITGHPPHSMLSLDPIWDNSLWITLLILQPFLPMQSQSQ